MLFIVATPIGNLQDLSFRAVKILQSVSAVACEDTRRAGLLLKHISEISPAETPKEKPLLISYYEQNEYSRIPQIINSLKNGQDIALISDAGMPTISDPGFKLVRECIKEGIKVEVIPGPSSVINALVTSGLPTDKFLFVGYPPKKPGHRLKFFQNINSMMYIIEPTIIIFEAPHKLIRTLEELKEVFGDIDIVICRELTKIHEEIQRSKISESLIHFEKKEPKGEIVVLFNI